MKNVSIGIVMLTVLIALLFGQIGLGEATIRTCNTREDLKAFTGVPTSGIVIEQLEQIQNY